MYLKMRRLVIISLIIIVLQEEILKLKEIITKLNFIGLNTKIFDEELIKLKISKEEKKHFVKLRLIELIKYSSLLNYSIDDFSPFTRTDLNQGYALIGKDNSHAIIFRNGNIVPFTESNFLILTLEPSAIKYFHIKWPLYKKKKIL
jgi:hypothetical protein